MDEPVQAVDYEGTGRASDAVWFTCCAWCASVKVLDSWVDSGVPLELVGASGICSPQVTHGICPACFRQVSERAERERRNVHRHVDEQASDGDPQSSEGPSV